MITRKFLLQVSAGVAFFCVTACGNKAAEQAQAIHSPNPMEIKTDAELRKRIKLGHAERRSVSTEIHVAGRVEADETRMARVSAPVTGRIIELNALEGQQVQRGQSLATMYSTELSAAQSAFIKAHSQRQIAERAVTRSGLLIEAGVIGEAEVQRREAELQQATADVAAAREQLAVLGLTPDEISRVASSRSVNSTTHILSSIDGIILERKVTIGQVVQAVETVFVVADLSSVWLVADVPEQSAGGLVIGKSVAAEIPALAGEKITGLLSFVSAIVNPETRTVRARMNLANPYRRYKPAMLTTMSLLVAAKPSLVVPGSAVVRENNSDYVFVQSAPNTFMLRRISLDGEMDNTRTVLDGLAQTETIVVDGAFHLNNERKRIVLGSAAGG